MAQPIMAPPPAVVRDPGEFAKFRTQMREQPEDVWQPLYDRVNYAAAGASQLSFFTVPIGQSATLIRAGSAASVTKTRRDTNLEQAGHIPSKAFKIHGFSLNYIPLQQAVAGTATDDIVDDIQRLAYGGYMEFKILDKTYLYLPLDQIPGSAYRGSTTGTNNVSAGGFGTGSPRDIYVLGIPLTLDPFQSFSITMYWDGTVALTQTFDLRLNVLGYLRRPGQ